MAMVEVEPGLTGECFPEIFKIPERRYTDKKPGQLTDKQLKEYFERGFLIVEDFFNKDKLQRCLDAIAKQVDDLAQRLYKAGKIKHLHEDVGVFQRLTKIEEQFAGSNVLLLKSATFPQAFRDLWTDEKLLNVVEQFIGPDIVGYPVWNLRAKVPQNEAATVPWHQDSAYLENSSYKVLIPTAWIPLIDANERNGCMQIAERGHQKGMIATHECCAGGTFYVMMSEEEMSKTLGVDMNKDIITCPVPRGGVLLFNNIIPHRSLVNRSNDIRWSLDLRFQTSKIPIDCFGMKGAIPFRSADNPNMEVEWEKHLVDRHAHQHEIMENTSEPEDEFDTTLSGPWMKKWEITHENRHTEKMTVSVK